MGVWGKALSSMDPLGPKNSVPYFTLYLLCCLHFCCAFADIWFQLSGFAIEGGRLKLKTKDSDLSDERARLGDDVSWLIFGLQFSSVGFRISEFHLGSR